MSWTGFIAYSINGIPPGLISILIISFVVTLFQILIYKKTSDQKRIKELKEKQKELQQKMKKIIKTKENKEQKELEKEIKKINEEMFKISTELMRLSLKPTLITLLPLILVFLFLKKSYTAANIGDIIHWGVNLPLIGTGAGWLLSYIIFGTIFSIILRKILKVH